MSKGEYIKETDHLIGYSQFEIGDLLHYDGDKGGCCGSGEGRGFD